MADYYALIKKTVGRLDSSASRESRRSLYERARVAQITQLRSISPPLSETEIICEQLELEEAVSRVEAEAAERAGDVCFPTLDDLVAAADDIGEPATRSKSRSSGVQAPLFSPSQSIKVSPTMVVSGGATGRLVRFWRWRSLPSRSVLSDLTSGR
jgi:hypothetical protein